MTLDEAQDMFRENPSDATAAEYLGQLLQYEADDTIGDDTFLDGLWEVQQYLAKAPGWRRNPER